MQIHHWLPAFILMTVGGGVVATPARAQPSIDPPRVEVTLSPGGGIYFTSENAEPDFGSYRVGGAVTVNLTRFLGVEGEVGGSFGMSQKLDIGAQSNVERKTPHLLDWNGNVVLSFRSGSPVVPYVTGGAGTLTLFSREELGVDETETYFTGNVGGGVKWLAHSGRWGLRGDYRFIAVRSKDDAPSFFGQTTRYGHRLYGAVLVTLD